MSFLLDEYRDLFYKYHIEIIWKLLKCNAGEKLIRRAKIGF
jgi:hypothetical protein